MSKQNDRMDTQERRFVEALDSELTRHGISHGNLQCVAPYRQYSDHEQVFVRLSARPDVLERTLEILMILRNAQVRAETALIDKLVMVDDSYAMVTQYVRADRPLKPSDAEAVGRSVREIHDALSSAYRVPEGIVYSPDDFAPRNIIIQDDLPVMIDLEHPADLTRSEAVARARGYFRHVNGTTADHDVAFDRGYGAY